MSILNRRNTSLIGAVCLCISMTLPTQATVITNGCAGVSSCTLDELFSGGTIGIDDVTFDSWLSNFNATLTEDFNTGAIGNGTVDTSAITVSGIDASATGNANEFTLGLMFSSNAAWSILDVIGDFLSVIEMDFSYNANATNGTEIIGTQLRLGSRFVEDWDSMVEVGLDSSGFSDRLETFERYFEFDVPQRSMVDTDSETLAGVTLLDLNSIIDLEIDSFDEPGHQFEQDVSLDSFTVLLTVRTSSTPPQPVSAPATISLFILTFGLLLLRSRKTIK